MNNAQGQLGAVAFTAEMSEIEVLKFYRHDFGGGPGGVFV